MRSGNDDFVHGHLEQSTQGIEVIYAGKALPSLPFVDGLRFLKAKIGLEVTDRQATILPKPTNIRSGGHRIDNRKRNHSHMHCLHLSG